MFENYFYAWLRNYGYNPEFIAFLYPYRADTTSSDMHFSILLKKNNQHDSK